MGLKGIKLLLLPGINPEMWGLDFSMNPGDGRINLI